MSLAYEWLEKARRDWVSMDILIQSNRPEAAEAICFHAQQAIEKLMKGLLVQKHITPPKTHHLIELHFKLEKEYSVSLNEEWLEELSIWAVESRYPGVTPGWDQAMEAAQCCLQCREKLLPLFQPGL